MKRSFVVLIVGCFIWLGMSGCGEKGEQSTEQAGQGQQDRKKSDTQQIGGKKQSSGVGMVKAPTRLHPGWECPTMPGIKSAYPGNCPGTKVPMSRKGEWTCHDHPQVSAAGPGQCPLDAVDLVKVQDLEKEKGKTISELTKEALAAKK
ncbi:MAG: hypothetical protein QGG48_05030 [Desulfatiglandales bacterium]|nr:hypothetical protein [Desulfatiglandales bacterium]